MRRTDGAGTATLVLAATRALGATRAGATAALALALLATGCIRDPDPFTVDSDDIAVHLILEAGSDSAAAIVERPGVLTSKVS